MDEHRKFLADRLLSESRPISYRALSSSLDVHVNRAKGMLFDFHRYQNELLSDSIYATYLVSGLITSTNKISDVAEMTSLSRLPESLARVVGHRKLTLVGEENLRGLPLPCYPLIREEPISDDREDALGMYISVTSLHVYGLSPNTMKDFWLYEDAVYTDDIMVFDRKQAGLDDKHGTIRNSHMRLRDRKSQLNSFSSGHVQSVKQQSEKASPNKQETSEPLRQEKQQLVPQKKEPVSTSIRLAPKTILHSFAKEPIHAFAKSTKQMKQTDEPAAALSDDGEPDDSDILPSKSSSVLQFKTKSRKDREDALRRMMEDDYEGGKQDGVDKFEPNMEVEESPEPESSPDVDPESGIPSTAAADKEPSETISSSGNGRRRGKRRVLQKKRILDDQGYMVTIQEPGWESFSEDETPPPAKKPTPPPLQPSSSAKAKKTSTRGSQGSIMSFFAKK